MKVFFDTNVYVAEALLGETAERLVAATFQGPNPVITILPPASENPPRAAYCKRDGNNLNVQFENIGGLATTGSVDVTVTFSTSPPAAITRTRGPLDAGEVATLSYPIPPGCFSPDCRFTVKWSNQPEVAGICIG